MSNPAGLPRPSNADDFEPPEGVDPTKHSWLDEKTGEVVCSKLLQCPKCGEAEDEIVLCDGECHRQVARGLTANCLLVCSRSLPLAPASRCCCLPARSAPNRPPSPALHSCRGVHLWCVGRWVVPPGDFFCPDCAKLEKARKEQEKADKQAAAVGNKRKAAGPADGDGPAARTRSRM